MRTAPDERAGDPAAGRRTGPLGRLARRASAFARLPGGHRLVFLRYLLAAAGLEVALRVLTPARLIPAWARAARFPAGRPGSGRARHRPPAAPARRRLVVRAAAVVRPGRHCLPAALLLWRGALRAGDAAQLVVGVRTAPAFRAHAWVELPDGRVLGGAPAALTPLAVWGPAGELRPGSASARHAGQRP